MARPKKTESNLSKQTIIRLALSLLEENGSKAISFRSLADQLGVTAMAVKHHVGSKEELLRELVSMAFQDIATEAATTTPNETLLIIMERYCQKVVQHSKLLNEILINPALMDDQLSQLNTLIMEQLQKAGIEETKRHTVLGVIIDYTHGFAFSLAANTHTTSQHTNPLSIDDYVEGLELLLNSLVTQSS
jgi:AcrR family transcriptional regulator